MIGMKVGRERQREEKMYGKEEKKEEEEEETEKEEKEAAAADDDAWGVWKAPAGEEVAPEDIMDVEI